ncbi:uncharacterized protein LOC105694094 isoform X2 [Athalia rosae]|uniref:uncharacterized protein LOC105694094 isoform X2 n=1 Tax=Athalia rosae TaxID=37344 RepID=UPI002033EF1D|nr:uncharacterized protein LOC105694094 isoform X2 [Athalia rosae]
MSAESPRRGNHKGAQVISPQPVSDRSIIESVAGIINDIVPQSYTGSPNLENKESITWARFEYADVNDPALYPDYNEGSSTPPLLLVLGYGTGVQVWLVTASGEATEVLSWRQGIVRTLRFLPNPKPDNDQIDLYQSKRPMVAICDSAGPGPQFCSIGFISLKTGEQVKSIKFKNPVNDVLANRRSIVVTFSEKIAVFDAKNLDDVLTVTTCYLSPGPNSNPIALGTRWLAYSEKKLLPARRSSGGSEGEGAQSYTATVLHAAKSLGKGLRGLGETVASTITGNSMTPTPLNSVGFDTTQPGVVTILDLQSAKEDKESDDGTIETMLAHFTAHSDAIVAMTFDLTGALLLTADRRGHDFHIFRIQPHPGGPTLAAVHHLYVLHRGDTTAKVQDMTFSSDARWAAISTVRGTTHVFPVAPYGGPVGVRTHSTPHVVNRLSRFHRSAGLTADGTRSHSPVAHAEIPLSVYPYSNPRLPPYPHPTILHPLAQIRQPSTLNHVNNQPQPRPQQRQRLQSEDSGSLPLKICSCFAPQRAWIYAQRDTASKVIKRPVDSLFIMACHGNMIQYDLEPKPAAGVPKEKVCDDTTIELEVEARGQWPLLRSAGSLEILPPLSVSSPLLGITIAPKSKPADNSSEDQWLSQVEIVTHAGPHRRLWMGPQFIFKTYNAPSGVAVNLVEAEAVEVGVTGGSRPARSNPVNMPHTATRPLVPVVIDGSGSSYEQSPRFLEAYGDSLENESIGVGGGENQLREDLAEAMLETAAAPHRAPGRRVVVERMGQPVAKVVNPLGTVITISADEEDTVSSGSYETDNTLEPLRSLCAEEGPASLDDFRQESQAIKNLSEICAEMRVTGNSAIDSLTNDDIKEVVERKALYAEAARLKSKGTVNFDEAEAFTDVKMTLNLCAEAGKIPTSPMTQANENPWIQRMASTDRKLADTKIARAKYVINYDEETIVFTDNRALSSKQVANLCGTADSSSVSNICCKSNIDHFEDGETHKRPNQVISKNLSYRKKNEKLPENKILPLPQISSKVQEKCNQKETTETKMEDTVVCESHLCQLTENIVNTHNAVKDTYQLLPNREKFGKKKIKNKCRDVERLESTFETIKDAEINAISSENLASKTDHTASNQTRVKSSSSRSLCIDDVDSEYSILEKNESLDRHSVSSNHSDEDLEHIDSSEVVPTLASKNSRYEISEINRDVDLDEIPALKGGNVITQHERKSSRAASSDDDMEHIQSSEVPQEYSSSTNPKNQSDFIAVSPNAECIVGKNSRKTYARMSVSPATDLNIECSEKMTSSELSGVFNELYAAQQQSRPTDERICSAVGPICPSRSSTTLETTVNVSTKDQGIECNTDSAKGKSRVRPNKNRKKKDDVLVVVVSGSTGEKEALMRCTEDSHALNKKYNTPEIDLAGEIDGCVEPIAGDSTLLRRFINRDGKPMSNEATSLDNIEIIDIDALRRAEAESESNLGQARTSECIVSELRPEVMLSRPKKSKRSRKSFQNDLPEDNLHNSSPLSLSNLKLLEMEICQKEARHASDFNKSEIPNSWSSIVKKSKDSTIVEICEKVTSGIRDLPSEAEVIQKIRPKSINLSEFAEDEHENKDGFKSVWNNEKSPSKQSTNLTMATESHVAENLDGDKKCLVEKDRLLTSNLDDQSNASCDVAGTSMTEMESSCSPANSPPCNNHIIEPNSEEMLPNLERNSEKDELPQLISDSIPYEEENASHVITESESIAKEKTGDILSSSSHSSKEPSPELEPSPLRENDYDKGATARESSHSLDEPNFNANIMDTEEDNSSKENVEKCLGSGGSSVKKGRSKKKRRR